MKYSILFLLILLNSCQPNHQTIPPDLDVIGSKCDELRATGSNYKAAQLYFKTGQNLGSSELFVYAAWQFGKANMPDSALVAINYAIDNGMSNPKILDAYDIDETTKNSVFRQKTDSRLDSLKTNLENIDNFEIILEPMESFWSYFDIAIADTAKAKQYLSEYILNGSTAIKDYYHIRYENVDNMYQTMIIKNPDFYEYLKKAISEEHLNEVAIESKQMMMQFAKLYPRAVFPKTYIVPDLINSSGTLTELGLYVGLTMFAKSENMPQQNLNNWQLSTITEFDNMKFDLVHELMHYQQSYSDEENENLLLGKLIQEGACDFLVSLLTEKHEMSPAVNRRLDYINDQKNRAFVLKELKRDLYSQDLSKWMHNGGGIKDRPSNLGYTMGYLICKSYYDNTTDKKQAVYELLNTDNFKRIIEESEYNEIL
ncbi:DUF2268 domain-containing putative Zn-dependent protease [Maribacter sp. 4G9]|uniref:DUF2268 domain-containing putative Zn-dependent protease n=1 Tax=Maribacter sp. 4G9 TaxID=1889777 RepID=UPI000C1571D5|nr:DUF2268 domain-containing putative Zn-dependent protease [Maribacter sp. 4G9]PIB37967.1 hypothetical protein BFP75_18790 [Maribacter sp. 4G9]